MQSVLNVVTPAVSQDLTILATVKAECGITGTAEDANIEAWIDQASNACSAYCNRVFGLETVTETFRNRFNYVYRHENKAPSILLQRNPVVTITSIVQDGTSLVADVDYQLDAKEGLLYRLDPASDALTFWNFNKLTVTYSGGWALLGSLPLSIERACISHVKALRSSADRDPNIKQESIPGVLETSYWIGGPPGSVSGALSTEVTALLDPFRNVSV